MEESFKKASEHLAWIESEIHGKLMLGDLVSRMEHRGFGLLIFIFAVPFIQPVPSGGLSTAFGSLILLLGLQLSLHRKTVWLPAWLNRTQVDEKTGRFLISAAKKFFGFIERFVHPRFRLFCKSEVLIGIMIATMAGLLMLPIPLPFSNTVCAIPIALWAISLIEGDGIMSALAFLFAAACIVFHALVFYVAIRYGLEAVTELWKYIFQ